jgi:hypothetical protein
MNQVNLVRALDGNGDWTFGLSLNNYISGNPMVAQDCQTRVSSFIGNCFFDMGAGIDWFSYLAGSKNQLALELAISAVLLNTYGVIGVNQISVTLDTTRNINIAYNVTTIFTGSIQSNFIVLTDENGNPLTDENGNILLG